mmetsp:Transcript_15932/g.47181  ORF Transcript_15932/g.47181 Transcript_15932/m.47181 type:complete len:269 (-) Transcript_15932:2-808(-)
MRALVHQANLVLGRQPGGHAQRRASKPLGAELRPERGGASGLLRVRAPRVVVARGAPLLVHERAARQVCRRHQGSRACLGHARRDCNLHAAASRSRLNDNPQRRAWLVECQAMEGALERGLVARGGGDAALARRGPAFSQIVRTHGRRREAAACGRWRRGRSRCKGRGRGWRRSNIYSLAALAAPRRQRVSRGEGQVPVTRCFGVLGPEVRLGRLRRRRCTQGHSLQRASRSGVWDRSRSGPGVQTHSSEDRRRRASEERWRTRLLSI